MSIEKNDNSPDNGKNTGSVSQKQQAIPPGSHTEIGSAELVVSGPGANINVNKASYQDFIEIYEHAFKQGRDTVVDKTITTSREKSQGDSGAISKSSRTNAFISYSHADKKYLEELRTHLAYYARNGMISLWDATMIEPGTKWREKIRKALQSARVAILLVSAEFLASDFIAANELPPLLTAAEQEGTVILPIILRACAFQDTDLAQFQAVNTLSNPLCAMTRHKRDNIWASVAERIKNTLKPS